MYCYYEQRDFPEEQFADDPEFGTVHKVPPRHTRLGSPVSADWDFPALGGA